MKIYLDKWYMITFVGGAFMAMRGEEAAARIQAQRGHAPYKLHTDIAHISSPLPSGYIAE